MRVENHRIRILHKGIWQMIVLYALKIQEWYVFPFCKKKHFQRNVRILLSFDTIKYTQEINILFLDA